MHGIPTLPHIYYGLISWYKHIRFIRISYLYFDHTRQLIDFIVQNETEMGIILLYYMHAWIMHTQQAYYVWTACIPQSAASLNNFTSFSLNPRFAIIIHLWCWTSYWPSQSLVVYKISRTCTFTDWVHC